MLKVNDIMTALKTKSSEHRFLLGLGPGLSDYALLIRPTGVEGGEGDFYGSLFLHEADQDNGAFFAVVGLEDGFNSLERPFIQFHGLARFDASLLRHGVQAVFDVLDDVIRDSGGLVGEADDALDSPRGAQFAPHWIGLLQVHEQVAGEQGFQLFGAFAGPDFFYRDFRVEAGDVLVLQVRQGTVALAGLVL